IFRRAMMNEELAYQQSLDYLYSFIDYSLQRMFRASPERFDMGRMHALMAAIGNPHQSYPVIHVAGTKGKGSVSVLCASALQAMGYKVGLYTSPHLQEYTERIQINHQDIPRLDFVRLVEEVKPYVDTIPKLTTFEITTAMMYRYFSQQQVDVAIIEVGLGGRLDATNVVVPRVSVITSISYDHAEILGDTLALIAAEKSGIIKPEVPVVVAPQREEARRVITRIATERNSPLLQVGKDLLFAPVSHSLNGQTMLVWHSREQEMVSEYIESGGAKIWEPTRLNLSLLGYHQVQNAATAYAALHLLNDSGLTVSEAAIQTGFAQTCWPARFEILQRYPAVVVDAAHNRDSAQKLSMAIGDYFPAQPVVLIFGASEDKDVEGMFAELLPRVRQVIATQSIHPRAMDAEKLVILAHQFGRPAKMVTPLEDALAEAVRIAAGEAVVMAAGSIFLAAGIRQAWKQGVKNG
ncbi:MAG: folylpolyglutamate synthase/dihydrofolate synthase family protein, partial [Chloroflexota bacterium]